MLKTIQKRMTVVLIVLMLLQLFVGVSPVLANDLSDQNVELVEDVGEDIEEEYDQDRGEDGAADIGNGKEASRNPFTIKRGDVEGIDLTYVRDIQNLSPDNVNKITFNKQEHEINNEGITGFFAERSKESNNISLESAGPFISINPEDVQNSRIILNAHDSAKPVAGFGSALDFPANSQSRINVPFKDTKRDEYNNDDTKISGNSDFTISMWIFPQGNEPYQTLFRQYGDANDSGNFGLDFRFIKHNEDEGYLYFGFNSRDSGGWQNAFPWGDEASIANITKIPINQWTHVALTKSGKSVILYANGTKYYEMTLDELRYAAHAPLKNGNISIGGTPFVDQFFCGRMDEIQYWNTALTPVEIEAWMYREIDNTHKKYNNLVYYYKLNQNSGTTVIDSKGSYDGNTVNMTDKDWIASNVRDWSVTAGSTLKGRLVGSYLGGSSKNGTDWRLTFEIVEQAKKGTATITGENEFEYCTKDTKQIGSDSFTYKVKDPNGRYSNTFTMNIDIIPAPINYIDENGETKSIGYNNVTKITSSSAILNNGWYFVDSNITRSDTITVNGNVHLILADNSSLTVIPFKTGINVSENNSLTIYAQSDGDKAGSLNVISPTFATGIGGAEGGSGGNVTINGGIVRATGGSWSAGIGGGAEGSGGNITINGGIVTAGGDRYGAGIGGGNKGNGGNVIINGGTVTAMGGDYAAGIGGGENGNGGNVIINGGTVAATGGDFAAGIGGGCKGNGGTIIIKNHP
ncbi:MAG: Ig-like domain-containing protein, partial [Syntrophomonas sp.]|nr:Ig-like domain-containing protein [Syntrophomonas sp.]